MKIKNILLAVLFLICNAQAQDNSIEAKLKSAIDNQNIQLVKELIETNPSLLDIKINNKLILDYALDVAMESSKHYRDIIISLGGLDDDSFDLISYDSDIEDDNSTEVEISLMDLIKAKRCWLNSIKILDFLEEQKAKPNNISYHFFKSEILPEASTLAKDQKLLELIELITTGFIHEAIDLIKSKEFEQDKEYLKEEDSSLALIVDFLELISKGDFSQNKDILKSILLGDICQGCNANIVSQSIEWKVYNIAKENNFKSLVKFIREIAGALFSLNYKALPEEIKREIAKFL